MNKWTNNNNTHSEYNLHTRLALLPKSDPAQDVNSDRQSHLKFEA
jgi:hypothetical protein